MSTDAEHGQPPQEIPRSLWGFTRFLWREIVAQRKWFLVPLWLLLALLALLITFSGGSVLLPAIYITF